MPRTDKILSVDQAVTGQSSITHRDKIGARGNGDLVDNYIKVEWGGATPPGSYFIVANERGAQKAIGKFEIPPGGRNGRIFVPVDAEGSFVVGESPCVSGPERTIGLFTRPLPTADLGYDAATTSVLGGTGTRISCISRLRREGAR
jgi:hypothetical protein